MRKARTAARVPTAVVSGAEWARSRRILRDINWSFSTPFSVGRSGVALLDVRKYHWYPGTFIPEIPYTLIEILAERGECVYDPFAGISTTLFQAAVLGRRALGTDTCRVAVDIARSIWRVLQIASVGTIQLDIGRQVLRRFSPKKDYAPSAARNGVDVDALRPWFHRRTLNEIFFLATATAGASDLALQSAGWVSLSATLKAACGQDRGWGCIADNMLPKPNQRRKYRPALRHWRTRVSVLLRDANALCSALADDSKKILCEVRAEDVIGHTDARHFSASTLADVVVTSPPYPNMTDYATSQRLSYYLLGMTPEGDLAAEIGARRRRFKSDCLSTYRLEMLAAIESLLRRLRAGGTLCLVMPSFDTQRENDRERRQVVQECIAALVDAGLVLDMEMERMLPRRRRHHNQHWTSLERESISVFRRIR